MEELKNKTDSEIVEMTRKDNREAYSEIIRRYQDKLMRYAQYLTGDYDRASDVVQESFIKAYVNLNGFDKKKNLSNWIYRIVHNEAINLVKKDKKNLKIDDEIDFSSDIDIEDSYIKSELVSHAHDCLGQMDLIYSEPLSLYYLEDKNYEEISDILRLPMGTVATRINRAKILMRNICLKKMN